MSDVVTTDSLAANTPASERRAFRTRSRQSWFIRNRLVLPLASLIVFLVLWQIVGMSLNPIVLATPTAVVQAFATLVSNGQMESAFELAMQDFALGFALAIVVGLTVGILMGRSIVIERILNPYISFFQAMPSVAVLPLVVVWLGTDYMARVSFVFWLAVVNIIVNTYAGMIGTPKELREVGKIYHLSEFTIVRRIAFPYALPFVFAGLRRGLGLALIGMLLGQMDISVKGLGGLIITYGDELRTDYLLAGICVAALVGVLGVAVLEILRKTAFPWIDAVAGRELAHEADG
jgi:ABC-type nitrate/sulfonate/bicarbonate transport system permease component